MRHPGSGPQHTLSPQPSLTDGRGEERRGGRGRWGGAEVEWGLHTNHSQINSLLPQSTILPPSSLPHLSLFFNPTFTPPSFSCLLPHLLQPLSLQLFCPPLFCFHVFSPLPHLLCVAPRFIPRAPGPENQVSQTKKKKDTCAPGEWAEGCALGQGA